MEVSAADVGRDGKIARVHLAGSAKMMALALARGSEAARRG
jgi:hypothetical protein